MKNKDVVRWIETDRYGNEIYLTQERWRHIIEDINHPEMAEFEIQLQSTIKEARRKQDTLNPQKYRYSMAFNDLIEDNTHIVAIVLFRYRVGQAGEPVRNNYIVTAYQKEIW